MVPEISWGYLCGPKNFVKLKVVGAPNMGLETFQAVFVNFFISRKQDHLMRRDWKISLDQMTSM